MVLNATFDPVERRWKALEPASMYRAQRFATSLYRHELCRGLRALGYEIENHARGFEIKGVPQCVIALFSKRHQQIDEETSARIANGAKVKNVKDLRERVAHGNRRRKLKDSTADRLRPSWRKEMRSADLAALKALESVRSRPAEKVDVVGIVAWADAHLFERRSVVNDHELMATALERGRGQEFDLMALRHAIDQRGYVREEGTTKLTSREALGWELEIVVAAHDGRNQHPALSPTYKASEALSPEQTAAVVKILGSRDFVTLFRGGAGTGKSFALKEVERGLVAAKRPVVVLAPQRQQVQDLQADGLRADTVASLLQTKQLPRDAVVIVDEAGQVGGRDLAQLVRTVQAHGGRLILSGDTRQHGPVAASDALRAIEKHAGLKPAEIQTIRRQDTARAASQKQREFIRGYRSAVAAAAKGKIVESFDRLDEMGCVRELAVGACRDALAAEYLSAINRKERALVVAQTRDEVRGVNEVIRARLREAGKIGEGATLTTCQPLDLSGAQKRDPRFYEAGQLACFLRSYGRYAKGDLCTIAGANERGVIIEKNGRLSTLSYRYTDRIVVGAAANMEIAPGDRLQLKFNGKSIEGARLNNGELVTVRAVKKDGRVVVESSQGARKTLAPSQRVFLRGYAVTSYGSQGKTVDKVIFSDTGTRAATSAEQWYVTISRGRTGVVIFTPDKAALRANIQTTAEREMALDLKSAPTEAIFQRPAELTRRDITAAEFIRRHHSVAQQAPAHRQHHRVAI